MKNISEIFHKANQYKILNPHQFKHFKICIGGGGYVNIYYTRLFKKSIEIFWGNVNFPEYDTWKIDSEYIKEMFEEYALYLETIIEEMDRNSKLEREKYKSKLNEMIENTAKKLKKN